MMMNILLIESASGLCRIKHTLNLNPEFITDLKLHSLTNRIITLGNYNGNLEYILDSKSIDLNFTLNQIIRK